MMVYTINIRNQEQVVAQKYLASTSKTLGSIPNNASLPVPIKQGVRNNNVSDVLKLI